MSDITVHCPSCGSEKIRAKREAYAEVEVYDWHNEDGDLYPDVDDESHPDWEPADVRNQFVCYGCRWEGNTESLVVREVPGQSPGQADKSPDISE